MHERGLSFLSFLRLRSPLPVSQVHLPRPQEEYAAIDGEHGNFIPHVKQLTGYQQHQMGPVCPYFAGLGSRAWDFEKGQAIVWCSSFSRCANLATGVSRLEAACLT